MSTEITKTSSDLISFDQGKIALIKRMVAKDATDDELELFLHQCRRTGLDPMAKQIYFQKRAGKPVIITGIDGYRLVADRTGLYAGNDDPVFDNEENPAKATVAIYKMISGQRCAFTATARWNQYYPGDQAGQMWRKMPHLMLGKCAEALALRKAFPAELSGMHTDDEMAQSGVTVTVDAPQKKDEGFLPGNLSHTQWMAKQLKAKNVPEERWEQIGNAHAGRAAHDLERTLKEVLG